MATYTSYNSPYRTLYRAPIKRSSYTMRPTSTHRNAQSPAKSSLASRRQFLAASAASGLITAGYFGSCAAEESTSPNERLNLACIGTANQAAYDINECKHEQIAVLCDVDANYIEQNLKTFPAHAPMPTIARCSIGKGTKLTPSLWRRRTTIMRVDYVLFALVNTSIAKNRCRTNSKSALG